MRLLIVTDAWTPQVNGVVRTLERTRAELEALGHEVSVLSPDLFASLPCPSYPEIRLALPFGGRLERLLEDFAPDALHIATEGPLGLAARRLCLRRGWRFTTSFHTRFPEYVAQRWGLPASWGYAFLRRFHAPASAVLVPTRSAAADLLARGFEGLRIWSRGVDTALFKPGPLDRLGLPRPVWLYVGRLAVEKNVPAFLDLVLPGTKLVVGDGPMAAHLRTRYPAARFVGAKTGPDLAAHYAEADVFVFPSRTDTFGLVLLEALACGVPVAAYPVCGPLDVIGASGAGSLDEDLGRAARRALTLDPAVCRAHALRFSWRACAEAFLEALTPLKEAPAVTKTSNAPRGLV